MSIQRKDSESGPPSEKTPLTAGEVAERKVRRLDRARSIHIAIAFGATAAAGLVLGTLDSKPEMPIAAATVGVTAAIGLGLAKNYEEEMKETVNEYSEEIGSRHDRHSTYFLLPTIVRKPEDIIMRRHDTKATTNPHSFLLSALGASCLGMSTFLTTRLAQNPDFSNYSDPVRFLLFAATLAPAVMGLKSGANSMIEPEDAYLRQIHNITEAKRLTTKYPKAPIVDD